MVTEEAAGAMQTCTVAYWEQPASMHVLCPRQCTVSEVETWQERALTLQFSLTLEDLGM